MSDVTPRELVMSSNIPKMQAGEKESSCKYKINTAINSVYYQGLTRGLSQFAEGTATQ